MTKYLIPKSRIPKVDLLCPKCDGGTKIVLGSPFAAGYHRRHVCRNPWCGYAFYSLAPYDGGEVSLASAPFKDRALTAFEEQQRTQWWDEELFQKPKRASDPDPFINRLIEAVTKEVSDRTETDHLIVEVFNSLKKEVETLENE